MPLVHHPTFYEKRRHSRGPTLLFSPTKRRITNPVRLSRGGFRNDPMKAFHLHVFSSCCVSLTPIHPFTPPSMIQRARYFFFPFDRWPRTNSPGQTVRNILPEQSSMRTKEKRPSYFHNDYPGSPDDVSRLSIIAQPLLHLPSVQRGCCNPADHRMARRRSKA